MTEPTAVRVSGQTDEQVARLQRALDKITNEPEHHDQAAWFTLSPHGEFNERHPNLPDLIDQMSYLDEYTGEADEGGDLYGARLAATDYLDVNGQTTWHCGTAGCLAGHVVLGEPDLVRGATILLSEDGDAEYMLDAGGERFMISGKARELLGLNGYQREILFSGSRTVVELWALAEIISGGRITMPEDRVTGNPKLIDEDDGEPFTAEDVQDARWRFGRDARLLPHPGEVVYRGPA